VRGFAVEDTVVINLRFASGALGTVGLVRDDPLQHQMAHFARVVRGEEAPLVSARDGLNNLRVTEAIAEAAARGCAVAVA